eukprot:3231486-Prorocentrum_lima.AAC.1
MVAVDGGDCSGVSADGPTDPHAPWAPAPGTPLERGGARRPAPGTPQEEGSSVAAATPPREP